MTPGGAKTEDDQCCFALVRATDALVDLERWRREHEQSPVGAHAMTRNIVMEQRKQVDTLQGKLDAIATRQQQILASMLASMAMILVNIVVVVYVLEYTH